MSKTVCCLCGLSFQQIGHNPYPLADSGRCCDACHELVVEAQIQPATVMEEVTRVEKALARMATRDQRSKALAAVCVVHGPELLAERQWQVERLRVMSEREKTDAQAH
ncbi:MAG TPA: hypothetical protein VGG68_00025 [Caulobacteraceae bacterium]|jgi:hypothetical protein